MLSMPQLEMLTQSSPLHLTDEVETNNYQNLT